MIGMQIGKADLHGEPQMAVQAPPGGLFRTRGKHLGNVVVWKCPYLVQNNVVVLDVEIFDNFTHTDHLRSAQDQIVRVPWIQMLALRRRKVVASFQVLLHVVVII